jgi:hypothetical protein
MQWKRKEAAAFVPDSAIQEQPLEDSSSVPILDDLDVEVDAQSDGAEEVPVEVADDSLIEAEEDAEIEEAELYFSPVEAEVDQHLDLPDAAVSEDEHYVEMSTHSGEEDVVAAPIVDVAADDESLAGSDDGSQLLEESYGDTEIVDGHLQADEISSSDVEESYVKADLGETGKEEEITIEEESVDLHENTLPEPDSTIDSLDQSTIVQEEDVDNERLYLSDVETLDVVEELEDDIDDLSDDSIDDEVQALEQEEILVQEEVADDSSWGIEEDGEFVMGAALEEPSVVDGVGLDHVAQDQSDEVIQEFDTSVAVEEIPGEEVVDETLAVAEEVTEDRESVSTVAMEDESVLDEESSEEEDLDEEAGGLGELDDDGDIIVVSEDEEVGQDEETSLDAHESAIDEPIFVEDASIDDVVEALSDENVEEQETTLAVDDVVEEDSEDEETDNVADDADVSLIDEKADEPSGGDEIGINYVDPSDAPKEEVEEQDITVAVDDIVEGDSEDEETAVVIDADADGSLIDGKADEPSGGVEIGIDYADPSDTPEEEVEEQDTTVAVDAIVEEDSEDEETDVVVDADVSHIDGKADEPIGGAEIGIDYVDPSDTLEEEVEEEDTTVVVDDIVEEDSEDEETNVVVDDDADVSLMDGKADEPSGGDKIGIDYVDLSDTPEEEVDIALDAATILASQIEDYEYDYSDEDLDERLSPTENVESSVAEGLIAVKEEEKGSETATGDAEQSAVEADESEDSQLTTDEDMGFVDETEESVQLIPEVLSETEFASDAGLEDDQYELNMGSLSESEVETDAGADDFAAPAVSSWGGTSATPRPLETGQINFFYRFLLARGLEHWLMTVIIITEWCKLYLSPLAEIPEIPEIPGWISRREFPPTPKYDKLAASLMKKLRGGALPSYDPEEGRLGSR